MITKTNNKNMTQTWRDAFSVYLQPLVFCTVALGFSAGLPYQLIFFTFPFWLREAGIDHATIGFLSWIGIIYTLKIFLSFIVERGKIPILTSWLGKRRSWMLFSQLLVTAAVVAMSYYEPVKQLTELTVLAMLIIAGSAIQDVVVDAYRVEAINIDFQGILSAAYVTGYRIALLTSGAGALYIAEYSNWQIAYFLMGCAMVIGILATLHTKEPSHSPMQKNLSFREMLIDPFVEFFQRKREWAIIVLLFISVYKMSDISLGVMSGTFYIDLGFTKSEIAMVTKVFSFVAAILGATFGGGLVVRYGVIKPLLLATLAASLTNLLFIALSLSKPTLTWLAFIVTIDSFCASLATTVLLSYLSSLISKDYTATQYALFSTLMTLPAQTVGGFSGVLVEHYGYTQFFIYSTMIGMPAVLLACVLIRESYTTH